MLWMLYDLELCMHHGRKAHIRENIWKLAVVPGAQVKRVVEAFKGLFTKCCKS